MAAEVSTAVTLDVIGVGFDLVASPKLVMIVGLLPSAPWKGLGKQLAEQSWWQPRSCFVAPKGWLFVVSGYRAMVNRFASNDEGPLVRLLEGCRRGAQGPKPHHF